LNLVGDFGGGGMLLTVGILAALHERSRSGQGQVVDAAMVDGAALLTAFLHGVWADGHWSDSRGTNLLDGGAPFYDTYQTAGGGYVAVGALERRFYQKLLVGLGLDGEQTLPDQMDRERWHELRARFAEVFASRARAGFVQISGVSQPAPAPRFSRTPAPTPTVPRLPGEDTEDVLVEWSLGMAATSGHGSQGKVAGL
jgi:alpha-methylacyl-CoA racemase